MRFRRTVRISTTDLINGIQINQIPAATVTIKPLTLAGIVTDILSQTLAHYQARQRRFAVIEKVVGHAIDRTTDKIARPDRLAGFAEGGQPGP